MVSSHESRRRSVCLVLLLACFTSVHCLLSVEYQVSSARDIKCDKYRTRAKARNERKQKICDIAISNSR